MKRTLHRWVPVVAFFIAAGCAHTDVARPSTQNDFGVDMARQNLWREAAFRFRRAVALNPSDAMAHNNLAVALEANGDFEAARKEYLEALKLDRSNDFIKKNYSRFVEFLSRNKKRSMPKTAGSPSAPAPVSGGGVRATQGDPGAPPDRPIGADPGALPRPPQPSPPTDAPVKPPAGGTR
jgi:tetratricopeptide (TPR) repeat protein